VRFELLVCRLVSQSFGHKQIAQTTRLIRNALAVRFDQLFGHFDFVVGKVLFVRLNLLAVVEDKTSQ
jgi:hypothetical protein